MKKNIKGSKHEKTLDNLVNHLLNTGDVFDSMIKHVEYKTSKYCGEIDLLVKLKGSDWYHFYEVKSNYSTKSFAKACEQYTRYCKAYPSKKVIGVFVTEGMMLPLKK